MDLFQISILLPCRRFVFDGLFISVHSAVPINTAMKKESELHFSQESLDSYSQGKVCFNIAMSTTTTITVIALIYLTGACALVCNIGQTACGNQCYYPLVYQCVEGHICRIAQKVCGGQCFYDIGLQECLEGHLCKLGQKVCNGQCYYPIGQKCIKREFLIWMKDLNGN